MDQFNVRVYGIVIEEGHVLLIDEEENGRQFTKFPGGGLEFGEGLTDALKREFMEECNAEITVTGHLYTTDFFTRSIFNESQLICVYYRVAPLHPLQMDMKKEAFDFDHSLLPLQAFRWRSMDELGPEDVTFPTDKRVVELLIEEWKKA